MWFLKLIRWPNILMILLTQFLVRYCIILPLMHKKVLWGNGSTINFLLLVIATMLVTAAGYIINDFYDLHIDRINKPQRMILGERISTRQGLFLYVFLNLVAILLGVFLSIRLNFLWGATIFPVMAFVLWFYSYRIKCQALTGNIVVSLLALVIPMVLFVEYLPTRQQFAFYNVFKLAQISIVAGFTLFAFIMTLLRELIKDVEDLPGDVAMNCRTFPAVFGISCTRRLILVLALITITLLSFSQFLLISNNFIVQGSYYLLVLQPLLVYLSIRIIKSKEPSDFKALSQLAKITMVAGILGMASFLVIN